MPVMDRDRWRELEPLLDRALEMTDAERTGWLARLRTESPVLAEELTSLLSDDALADGVGFLAGSVDLSLAGVRFGAYELVRPLGYGGMGHVWLARRADGQFDGYAAVKLLNLALLTPSGRGRFRREGSVLAQLTHPGIARLLDAGVAAGGQPYLVLEYIEGERIDEFADTRGLSLAERVHLVLQVLAAVGHAHANLIVHRDLKPSNILVAADGTARLLDFGIAKLLPREPDVSATELTAVGGHAHTPDYAAPEQLRGEAITTATDVYAVGVLLYLLLTGRRPFELAGRTPAEVERIVCESEPVRPSELFAREDMGGDAEARARARGSMPERLRRQLRGDLDAIALRALRKEPERRYGTASALAQDLERYLAGRPVLARPERATYRAWKFARRHRGGVAVAAAAILLLSGAGLRERTLRTRAEVEARTARAVEQYLESVFRVADPYSARGPNPGDVTARALLDRGAARLDATLAGQPAVASELRRVFGGIYSDLGMNDRGAALLERALEQRRALYGPRHPAVAEVMARLGQVRVRQGRFKEAEPLLREALAQQRAFLGERDTAVAVTLDVLAGLLGLREHRLEPADTLLREALAIRRAAYGDTAAAVVASTNSLAGVLNLEGKYEEAERLFRRALAVETRTLGPANPMTANTMNDLGQVEEPLGRYDEAERLYRRALAIQIRALGQMNPVVTISMSNLGAVLSRDPRRLAEAEALQRQSLALKQRLFKPGHPMIAADLQFLGRILAREGRFDEALAALRQSKAMFQKEFGPEHNLVATDLNDMGGILWARGDIEGATPLLRQALAQFTRLRGPRHYNTTSAALNLAGALRDHGDVAEAEQLFRATMQVLDTSNARGRERLATAEIGLGRTLLDRGRAAEARPLLERGLSAARRAFGATDPHTAEALLGLGTCLMAEGSYGAATRALEQAGEALAPWRGAQPRLAAQLDRARARLASASPS